LGVQRRLTFSSGFIGAKAESRESVREFWEKDSIEDKRAAVCYAWKSRCLSSSLRLRSTTAEFYPYWAGWEGLGIVLSKLKLAFQHKLKLELQQPIAHALRL
jgi:hypothetical protein